jgi:hypothetical protein
METRNNGSTMLRRSDPTLLTLAIIAAAFFLVALFIRPQPLPPGSAEYRTTQNSPAIPGQIAVLGHTYAIDILEANGVPLPASDPPPINTAGAITVYGWAVDPRSTAPGRRLLISIDGSPSVAVTTYGSARPDVAAAIGSAAANSGFTAVIPPHRLRSGEHVLRFTLVGNDGKQTLLPTRVTFQLVSGTGK